jgi:hypothetical protein
MGDGKKIQVWAEGKILAQPESFFVVSGWLELVCWVSE